MSEGIMEQIESLPEKVLKDVSGTGKKVGI